MPFTSFKTDINASAERVWEMMVEKIRRPDKYVPGVVSIDVLQQFSELSIERRMTVCGEGNTQKTVREIITADPATRTVIFKLQDDPVYTGYVLNMVFDEGGRVELDYTMHWTLKDPAAPIHEPD
ncbi:MAG: AtaL-like protein, partial [Pseudomonadota bacterium]